MSGETTATAAPAVSTATERSVASPVAVILRDITRGGVAGAIVGIFVAGVGGRIAMRLAAILVPNAVGSSTDNGNRIGEITVGGSLGLVAFGLAVGLVVGTLWVVVSPWIPGAGLRRAVLAVPIAVALGANGLIDGENQDFLILRHHPLVVALLVALVAGIGFALVPVDRWLDRRLPDAMADKGRTVAVYAVIASLGALFTLPMVVVGYFVERDPATILVGLALLLVAGCTLGWWADRAKGRLHPPARLTLIARAALVMAVVFGFGATIPEVSRALGMR